ncbi:MAG: putative effector of murein hydrolase LrgA [Defluviitaleaceae bacterium]|nr:putative effector of murein hydrolase LrgA [Defluviitaleaceae bacterium]
MLAALKFKIISLDSVRETGSFLIHIMPMLFIPAAVGLLTSWNELSAFFFPVVVITVVSTIMVMGVVGRVTQFVIHKNNR